MQLIPTASFIRGDAFQKYSSWRVDRYAVQRLIPTCTHAYYKYFNMFTQQIE